MKQNVNNDVTKDSAIDTRLSQSTNTPPVRVSLRLVLSVKFSSIDTRLSQATNTLPVRVSLRLVLSVKFSSIDTRFSQSTNTPPGRMKKTLLYYHITIYFTMFTFTNSKKEQTLVKVTQNNYKANRAE